jgi:hypothetical protein
MSASSLPTESALDKAVQEFGIGTYDFPMTEFDHGEDSEDLPSDRYLCRRALPDGGGPVDPAGPDRLLSYPETFASLPGDLDRPPGAPRSQDDTLQRVVPSTSQAKLPSDERNPSARSDYFDTTVTGQLRDDPWADEDSGAWASESKEAVSELPGIIKNNVQMNNHLQALGNYWSGYEVEDVTGPHGFPSTDFSENADFSRSDTNDGGRLMASRGVKMNRTATNFELVRELTDKFLKEFGKKGLTRRCVMAYLHKQNQPQYLASDIIRCLNLEHSMVVKDVLDEFPVKTASSQETGLDVITDKFVDAMVLCRDNPKAVHVLGLCMAAVSRTAGICSRLMAIKHVAAEVINLDSMFPSDLRQFAESTNNSQLASYARNKANAMDARDVGDISQAMKLEAICDSIYDKLPPNLKW